MMPKSQKTPITSSVGEQTLETISSAGNFNKWMYETIKSYCHGKVLEIGSGIGNISSFFINDNYTMYLSDLEKSYCTILRKSLIKYSNCKKVIQLDISDPDLRKNYSEYIGTFDTVFMLNVLEHIKDDQTAINNCMSLLKKGGTIVVLVPAYQTLYNRFDKELGHYRRYHSKDLRQIFADSNAAISDEFHFNALGILGWVLFGKLLQRKKIPDNQMQTYDKFITLAKVIDKLVFNKIGLSLIVVGEKK